MSVLRNESTASPTVSIGLPVYNGEDFLRETIESCLNQTYTDLELIITDNASTDGTEAICREYVEKDPRVVYYRHPENMGAAVNYNSAFHMARGKYYRWAAHDDPIAPTYIERCVEVLDSDPGCVLVYPGTVVIDAESNITGCYIDRYECASDDPAERLRTWLHPDHGHGQCNPFFGLLRPEVAATTGLHPDYPASDRVFLAEMAMRGRTRMVKEGLFLRRIHENNSVRANPNMRDLVAWFTGKKSRGLTMRQVRLTWGLIMAIRRAGLSFRTELECYRILYQWSDKVGILRELLVPLYMNGQPTQLGRWISGVPGLGKLVRG